MARREGLWRALGMFPLNLRTPTSRRYDPSAEVQQALRQVVLEPGQQPVICDACGCWWVCDAHEGAKFDGSAYARISSCPHCEIERRKPGSAAHHS
jgi:hypothetical protein